MTIAKLSITLASLTLITLAGCRGPLAAGGDTDSEKSSPFGQLSNPLEWGANPEEPRTGAPERVVATWVDTIRNQSGQEAERGFGGRVYFYDRGTDPITVEGRLVVYAFDESGRTPTDHQPTRRFIFPSEQLTRHMSPSEIGPSYSLWLPWGSVEDAPTRVSLIARFEPTRGGGLVVSDQATQVLPGQGVAAPDAGREMLASQPDGGVRQAGFVDPTRESVPVEERKRLATTTIRLGKTRD